MKNHPLFPEHPDVEVVKIHVTRFEAGGPEWCVTPFVGENLTELQQIFDLFGGGHYELVSHGPTKKGGSGINARQPYKIAGAPKPLNARQPDAGAPPAMPVAPAVVSGSDPMSAVLTLVGTLMTAMVSMMTAILTRPSQDSGGAAALTAMGEIMRGQTALLQTALQRPAEAHAQPDALKDPLKFMLDVAEVMTNIKQGAEEAIKKGAATAAPTTAQDLKELVGAADGIIDLVKKGRGLAEKGVPPDQAAADLANMAAGTAAAE